MKMVRKQMLIAAAGATVWSLACWRSEAEQPFLEAGEYTIVLMQEPGVRYLPDFERAFGPFSDSVVGAVTIREVRADSVFGRYDLALIRIGLKVGGPDSLPTSRTVAGVIHADSLRLALDPDVMDATLWLDGRTNGPSTAVGRWRDDEGLRYGTFRLSLVPAGRP